MVERSERHYHTGFGKRNLIITCGYGEVWEEIREVIVEVIDRVYPIEWRHFRLDFPVLGDLVRPIENEKMIVFGDLIQRFRRLIPVRGKKDLF